MTLSRRTLLSLLGTSALAAGLPGCGSPQSPVQRLVGASNAIGQWWLEHHPEDNDAEALAQALSQGTGELDPATAIAAIRDDFAQERIESVEGWLLARTECRLAALVVLSGGATG